MRLLVALAVLVVVAPAAAAGEEQIEAHGTTVVGVAVAEGIVLVADSRATLQFKETKPKYKVVSDSHNKVMAVGNFGLATYGTAFILDRSITSWVQDFESELVQEGVADILTLEKFLDRFTEYLRPPVEEQQEKTPGAGVGFLVGGYDDEGVGRLFQLTFPSATRTELFNTRDKQGMGCRGQSDAFERLVLGADRNQLYASDYYKQLDDDSKKALRTQLAKLEYKIYFKYLSLRDAVDLATFLVEANVVMQRFSFGTYEKTGSVPTVGGPVDSLAITPTGPKWFAHKDL